VGGYRSFGGADVGDHGLGTGRLQRLVHDGRERADGCAGEDGVGAFDGLGHRAGDAVDGATLERGGEHLGIGIEAGDLSGAAARGEADRAADQPNAQNR
jgi:hypothetical protein